MSRAAPSGSRGTPPERDVLSRLRGSHDGVGTLARPDVATVADVTGKPCEWRALSDSDPPPDGNAG